MKQEVKRTNFSEIANLYVNTHRKKLVDPIFVKKDKARERSNRKEAKYLDYKARIILREIITHANNILPHMTLAEFKVWNNTKRF